MHPLQAGGIDRVEVIGGKSMKPYAYDSLRPRAIEPSPRVLQKKPQQPAATVVCRTVHNYGGLLREPAGTDEQGGCPIARSMEP